MSTRLIVWSYAVRDLANACRGGLKQRRACSQTPADCTPTAYQQLHVQLHLDGKPSSMLLPCVPNPDDGQEPASAESALVANVWGSIRQILCTDNREVEAMIRHMSAGLPPLDTIHSHDLASLAQLHLKSSNDLMATAKILAPAVFRNGLSRPDISALRDDESGILGMLSNIIELQPFHVLRAQAITAAMRARVAAGQQHQQQQAQQLGAADGEQGPVTQPVLPAEAVAGSSNQHGDGQAHMGYLD